MSSLQNIRWNKAQTSKHEILPHIMGLPKSGQYFIGGFPAFKRNVNDYKILLKEVSSCGKTDDKENGQLLCLKLLGRELSNAIAIKNSSSVLWTDHTKDENRKLVPKLNEELLRAIFMQAKHQFPGFTDSLSDPNCKTVKALDNVCRKAQGVISSRQIASKK